MIRGKLRVAAIIFTLSMAALAAWILLQITRVVELADRVVPVDLMTPWTRFGVWWATEVYDALNVPDLTTEIPDSVE